MQKLGIIIVLLITLISCETSSPSLGNKLQLSLEDVSCTEAWLSLRNDNLSQQGELNITLNDSIIKSLTLNSQDTLLYIEDLRPGKTYTFKATYIPKEEIDYIGASSEELQVKTMDTTSHDFTWQSFTFGGVGGSSYLKDVAIIDENDIWAVGEIHTADDWDSEGNYAGPYNAVHWDGNKWELKRIMYYIDQDKPQVGKTSSPCESSFTFGNNKFAVTSNVQTAVFDEKGNYKIIRMGFAWEDRFTINAIWGTSSKDFYVVGNGGKIAHYDGNQWTKIESGIGGAIHNLWGIKKIITQKEQLYFSVPTHNAIYQMDIPKKINRIEVGNENFYRGIWTKNGLKLYLGGDGIVSKVKKNWSVEIEANRIFYKDIEGDGYNNIIAAGANGEVTFFNGIRWTKYKEITGEIFYHEVSVKSRIVVAVGEKYGREISGVILMGIRH